MEVKVKNRFEAHQALELITPTGSGRFVPSAIYDKRGAAQAVAPGDGHFVWIALPNDAVDLTFGLLTAPHNRRSI